MPRQVLVTPERSLIGIMQVIAVKSIMLVSADVVGMGSRRAGGASRSGCSGCLLVDSDQDLVEQLGAMGLLVLGGVVALA